MAKFHATITEFYVLYKMFLGLSETQLAVDHLHNEKSGTVIIFEGSALLNGTFYGTKHGARQSRSG